MKKTRIKILSVVLCAVMVLGAAPLGGLVGLDLPSLLGFESKAAEATTYSGTCGAKLTWNLDTETGELNITGTGAMTDWSYSSDAPWYSYRIKIKTVNIGNRVTTIGNYAFYYCTNLTSVTIPDSVTAIDGCSFQFCESLTSVTIPDSVEYIGGGAFDNCINLTKVKIGNSVTTINYGAFSNCISLINVTIPDSVTTIGDGAFFSCTSLTNITIPNSVTSIDREAFAYCNSLTNITIPKSVKIIGSYAFNNCINLTSITIPDSVTTIGICPFSYCVSLANITVSADNNYYSSDSYGVLFNKNKTELIQYPIGNKRTSYSIPNSVTTIVDLAFDYCTSLTNITVDSNNKNYSSDSYGVLFNKKKTTLIQYPIGNTRTSYTIPDSVKIISEGAFYNCDNLTSVTIPDSVTTIGDYAFYGCDSLTDAYYSGTETQWKKIAIDSSNNPLKNATIHYNSAGANSESVKIMSYNIYVKDGTVTDLTNGKKYDCSYENRVRYIVQNVHANMPDSFGVQEISKDLRNCLENYEDLNGGILKANYAAVGDYREGNNGENDILIKGDNEASLIYYNKTKFKCLESGTFWLSENGKTGSIHNDSEYPRICTYALLENKATGFTYLHVNTHIEHNHTGDDDIKSNDAAIYSSEKITEFIKYNYPDMPVVVTGDFNQTSSSTPYKNFVNAGYTDARSVYSGNTVTYPNPFKQGGKDDKPYGAKTIDHIFVNDYFEVSDYTVYDEDYTNKSKYGNFTLDYPYPSDHHPVVVTLDVVKEGKQTEVYNVGEDTYSFDNFSHLFGGGHCFGMSITSAGYYTDRLFITAIGGNKTDGLYILDKTDAVKEPICRYQKIQGSYATNAIVAGGRYYKYDYYDVNSDWNEVVNYVKNHQYDGKGNLQIGFRINGKNGHAVNFLRYSVVNGQERIYAYDNNFPDTETYFYKDSNGDIRQAPVATFNNKKIECIALRDTNKYFGSISSYDEKRYIYSEKDDIYVSGAKAYPIDCSDDSPEQVVYEIPANAELVAITPLTEDATFTYLDEEYSFEKDGEIALLSLGEGTEETSVEFTTDYLANFKIKTPTTTTVNYGDTLVLQADFGEATLPEGWSIRWDIDGAGFSTATEESGMKLKATSTANGTPTIKATIVDANGDAVLNAEGNEITAEITLKSNASFWQKIVSFFKNLFRINRIIY